MGEAPAPVRPKAPGATSRLSLAGVYAVETAVSFGSSLLTVAIFFYTTNQFHWGLRQNFMLAMGQGLVYIVGALLASKLAQKIGRRRAVVATYTALAIILAPAVIWVRPAVVATSLIAYMLVVSMSWPVVESLVCDGANASTLSWRLGLYNLLWSGSGAIGMAVSGTIIKAWPTGVLLLPAVIHLFSAAVIWFGSAGGEAASAAPAHAPPAEEGLRSQRRLALWLSRVALPSTYMVIYSLGPILPSLRIMQKLALGQQTLISSVWLAGRWAAFAGLGATVWWHARPRVLLWSAFVMAGGFLGTVLSAGVGSLAWAIGCMAVFQIVLGMALGMIYTASLYFGMVLSEGSTEHGGYHEALIGLGEVLAAGAGVAAQFVCPGSTTAAIVAVSGVMTMTLVAAVGVSVRARSEVLRE